MIWTSERHRFARKISGHSLILEVRKVDSQGRISLPVDWRREVLGDADEVYVFRDGESLVVRARREPDLTMHFDSVPVDMEPEAFMDYYRLKKALLEVAMCGL